MKGSWLWTGSSWMMCVCVNVSLRARRSFSSHNTQTACIWGAAALLQSSQPRGHRPGQRSRHRRKVQPRRPDHPHLRLRHLTVHPLHSVQGETASHTVQVTWRSHIQLLSGRDPLWVPPPPHPSEKKTKQCCTNSHVYFNNISVRQAYISQLHKFFNRTFAKHNLHKAV